MVLKPEPNRTIRLEKPRTTHFLGSFRLNNHSMGKSQGSVRTTIGPHGFENRDQTASHGSLLPFESELKKIKNTHTHTHTHTQTSFKFYLQSTSRSFLSSETLLLGKANFEFCHCHLQHHSFKFWLCSPSVMWVWQGESMREREWKRES